MNAKKVAAAILQAPQEIIVCDTTYKVAPPTIATLILASKEIADIPMFSMNAENIAFETLAKAEHYDSVGRVIAILILGAKKIEETTSTFIWRKKTGKQALNKLSADILHHYSPTDLQTLFVQLLGGMQIRDFFLFITSLNEINLLKPTKEVTQTTATALGR